MSELRQNLATKEWYLIATERAKRPHDFKQIKWDREDVEYSENCPFCQGNEHMTPNASLEITENGKWLVRAIPNKFSALSPRGDVKRHVRGIYRKMNGVGFHEVIIESPIHNDFYTKMSVDHIQKILTAYLDRFNEAMKDERIESVIIFKNYGSSAGSSLTHPHAQIIAAPIVPTPMRNILEAAKRYYDDMGRCAYCVMMEEELKEQERIVLESKHFVVFCPYASGDPFETWIVPKRHNPSFSNVSKEELDDLAGVFKNLFHRYYDGLGDPDFNYIVKTPPRDESNDRSYHWYIQVLPKLTKLAGFELGTGMLINVTLPADNARFLRELKIPEESHIS